MEAAHSKANYQIDLSREATGDIGFDTSSTVGETNLSAEIKYASAKPTIAEKTAAEVFKDHKVLLFLITKYENAISTIQVELKKKGEPELQKTSNPSCLKLVVSSDYNAVNRWVKKIKNEATAFSAKQDPLNAHQVFTTLLSEVEAWGDRGFSNPPSQFITDFVIRSKRAVTETKQPTTALKLKDLLAAPTVKRKPQSSSLEILANCFSDAAMKEEINNAYRRTEKNAHQMVLRTLGVNNKFALDEIANTAIELKKLAILSYFKLFANPDELPEKLVLDFESIHQAIEFRAGEPTTSALERQEFDNLENFNHAVSLLITEFDKQNLFNLIGELAVLRGIGSEIVSIYRLDWQTKAEHSHRLIEANQSMKRLANNHLKESQRLLEESITECVLAASFKYDKEDALLNHREMLIEFSRTLASLSVSQSEECRNWYNKTFEFCLGREICPEGTDAGFVYGCLIDLQSWYTLEKRVGLFPYTLDNKDIFQAILSASLNSLFEEHLDSMSLSKASKLFKSDTYHLERMAVLRDIACNLENATTFHKNFCFLHAIAEQDVAIKKYYDKRLDSKSRSKMNAMTESVIEHLDALFYKSPDDYRDLFRQYAERMYIDIKRLFSDGSEIGLALSLAERISAALEKYECSDGIKQRFSIFLEDATDEIDSLVSEADLSDYLLSAINQQLDHWIPVPNDTYAETKAKLVLKLEKATSSRSDQH